MSEQPKSCSRCGNRRRTEDHPNGHYLFPPYWDLSIVICRECARELAIEHDKNGYPPPDPGATWVAPPRSLEEEEQQGVAGVIPVPGWGDVGYDGKPVFKPKKIKCKGGPLLDLEVACYAVIPMVAPVGSGYYEYDRGQYIWHPEAKP